MQLKYRLGIAVSTSALIAQLLSPAAMAADLEISGNGRDSNNTINITDNSSSDINQTSNTVVTVVVTQTAKTGGNTANDNEGNVTIDTGNAINNATVNVTGGSNTITGADCGCVSTPSALISGNKRDSDNLVKLTSNKTKNKSQNAGTVVTTVVTSKAKTGKNKANDSTGNGTVNVTTGNSNNTANVTVTGGNNTVDLTPAP
jgi:hypothetical protein